MVLLLFNTRKLIFKSKRIIDTSSKYLYYIISNYPSISNSLDLLKMKSNNCYKNIEQNNLSTLSENNNLTTINTESTNSIVLTQTQTQQPTQTQTQQQPTPTPTTPTFSSSGDYNSNNNICKVDTEVDLVDGSDFCNSSSRTRTNNCESGCMSTYTYYGLMPAYTSTCCESTSKFYY